MTNKNLVKIKGKDLAGNEKTLEKSQPYQLDLFQYLLPDEERYSNTIELYDAIPRFFASTKKMAEMRENGKYLPTLRRSFKFKNTSYQVDIRPGRVSKKDGTDIEYYPSEREQFIEEALWKIAHDKLKGCYLDEMMGVEFTLYELRRELSKRGRSIHFDSLIESLTICNGCNIALKNESGKSIFVSPIFPTLLISSRSDWLQDPKSTKCYVQFNMLATQSLKNLNYRLFDYAKFMDFERILSRWFFKRISHNFTQASLGNFYTIKASSIIRDSGLLNCTSFRFQIRAIDDAMEELKEKRVVMKIVKNCIYDTCDKRKIADVSYDIYPTYEFTQQAIASNKRTLFLEEKAQEEGKLINRVVEGKLLAEIAN
jgi:hypothetical protein